MKKTTVNQQLKNHYDQFYDERQTQWRWLGALDKAANIVALCEPYPHNTILEIGAGEGAILQRLSELEFCEQLYALEISSSGVDAIQKRAISGLAEARLFDGYTISYDDRQFDLAILSHVVEHVEHPRKLLYEAARVARYVFVEVPLEDTLRMKADYIFTETGHINFYTPKTIRRLLQTCNFEILKQVNTNPSKAVHAFRSGKKGILSYYLKSALLKSIPGLATEIFTYHSALVCKSPET